MIENFTNTKGKGQNFLVDDNIVRKIVKAIPTGEIIEIGPGVGGITDKLLENRHLTLIEIDEELVKYLEKRYESKIKSEDVKIINEDATKFDYYKFNDPKLIVVGNLPYSVANRIIRNIGTYNSTIQQTIFMTQKEPALKLVGKDKKSGYGVLRTFINTFFSIELLFDVPPTAFKPKPKIISTVFSMNKLDDAPTLIKKDAVEYFNFIELLYERKRKTVLNNLKSFDKLRVKEILISMNKKEAVRPDELDPKDIYQLWIKLKD